MFSDEDLKEMSESSLMRPGDEIISIREVCLSDKFDHKFEHKFDKKYSGSPSEPLLLNSSGRNDLFRDNFFTEGLDNQQARFAWTEEDGNIASFVSEPGFGTTGHTTFETDLDADFKQEKDKDMPDISSTLLEPTTRYGITFTTKPYAAQPVSSTSSDGAVIGEPGNKGRAPCKVNKADPRSRFHYVKYVKRHGRSIKLWECGICCREFQHQYTLMRHLPTHTDERNFHCEECGKSFRQLSTLSQHRAIHSSERPYACEECKKTFNRVSTLISHRKTHSNEKPYKCHMCHKGFHQKGNLRNHMFTHTNERPYRCNLCMKGFNQQSNLVCHKNKVHPNLGPGNPSSARSNSVPLPRLVPTSIDAQPDSTKPPTGYCEVSSTVGLMPSMEGPSTSWHQPSDSWDSSDVEGPLGSGVIVDAIKTYHMEVAIATKQTPFALLKSDNGGPVLVKVIDTNLPGGKQMLVPATAEDLRDGGKIVLKNDENSATNLPPGSAVQIRVPVVATVVPKIRAGGRLQLVVEEPHYAFHTALSADAVTLEPCPTSSQTHTHTTATVIQLPAMPRIVPKPQVISTGQQSQCRFGGGDVKPVGVISSTCVMPAPAPSPPLDLINLDLFEPIECIPLGPQITPVDVDSIELHRSRNTDFCIQQFKHLSDSD